MTSLRKISVRAVAALAWLAIWTAGNAVAQEVKHPHLPAPGSEVVIYKHKFAPQHYEEGIELVSEGFAAVIKDLGQDRTNFIMVHPSTYEVLNVSFFENEEDLQRWHDSEGRLGVVDKLKPLMIAPIDIQVYTLEEVHEVE